MLHVKIRDIQVDTKVDASRMSICRDSRFSKHWATAMIHDVRMSMIINDTEEKLVIGLALEFTLLITTV